MVKNWFYQNIQNECIVLELVVVECRKKVVYEGKNKVEEDPNEPGSECSSVANFDGKGKLSAASNSRAPVLGLFGFKESDVPDDKVSETLIAVTDEVRQPAKGMLIACSTFPKPVRSAPGTFITGLDWSCVAVPGRGVNSPEAVRARLDAFSRGPDEMVKVAIAQLADARSSGQSPGLPSSEVGAAPEDGGEQSASKSAIPALPQKPAAPPPLPKKDPFAGWTPHPDDPNFFYNAAHEVKTRDQILAGK
jgi:hypothetical protein